MSNSTPSKCDGIIHVCGWCYPGKTVYLMFPDWEKLNLPISHGICIAHKEQMLMEVRSITVSKEKP
jgi:hypothetical protein